MHQKTSLYLICHTQTNWDKEKRIIGSSDVELNEEGVSQAKLLGEVFVSYPICAIYTSNKKCTVETANILGKTLNVTPKIQEGLDDHYMGEAEGMGFGEFKDRYAKEISLYYSLNYYERLFNTIVDGQESSIDLAERILPNLHEICRNHTNEHIVVIIHEKIIKLLLILIGKYKEETIEIENGAVLEMSGDGAKLDILTMQGIRAEKRSILHT